MARHVIVLGAGFGGLELSATLSEASGGEIEVTLEALTELRSVAVLSDLRSP